MSVVRWHTPTESATIGFKQRTSVDGIHGHEYLRLFGGVVAEGNDIACFMILEATSMCGPNRRQPGDVFLGNLLDTTRRCRNRDPAPQCNGVFHTSGLRFCQALPEFLQHIQDARKSQWASRRTSATSTHKNRRPWLLKVSKDKNTASSHPRSSSTPVLLQEGTMLKLDKGHAGYKHGTFARLSHK